MFFRIVSVIKKIGYELSKKMRNDRMKKLLKTTLALGLLASTLFTSVTVFAMDVIIEPLSEWSEEDLELLRELEGGEELILCLENNAAAPENCRYLLTRISGFEDANIVIEGEDGYIGITTLSEVLDQENNLELPTEPVNETVAEEIEENSHNLFVIGGSVGVIVAILVLYQLTRNRKKNK